MNNLLNKVILGDCLTVMDEIEDESVDLVIIDPPYNVKKKIKNDNLSIDEYSSFLDQRVKKIFQKMKRTASLYCFTGYKYEDIVKPVLMKYLIFKRELIWHYNPQGAFTPTRNYLIECDKIFFMVKTENYKFNIIRKKPSQKVILRYGQYVNKEGFLPYNKLTPVIQKRYKSEENYINLGMWSPFHGNQLGNVFLGIHTVSGTQKQMKIGKHITQKPIELITNFIKVSSDEGDVVMDCFAGSGSSLVAAKTLKRNYIGIEIDSDWKDLCDKNINNVITYQKLI